MNFVTVLWSAAGGVALLIAVVHATIWIHELKSWANLAIVVAALALVGVAITELGMMSARSADAWGQWLRWNHLPMFFLMVSLAAFVRLQLATGRAWMMWGIMGTCSVILVANFHVQPNFSFESIAGVQTISFLGQDVTVLSGATVSPFQWLEAASAFLLIAYTADATLTQWRRSFPKGRHTVLVGGVGTFLSVLLAFVVAQLVIWGQVRLPMLDTPAFLFLLLVLGYELDRQALRAGRLSRHLRDSDDWLRLAADSAQLGLWSFDTGSGRLWAADRCRALLGFGPREDIDLEKLYSQIHAEDRERVRETLDRSVVERTGYHVEFRVCNPRQAVPRWICSDGIIDIDDDGRRTLLRGILRNVTDQKLAQAEAEKLRSEVSHSGRITMLGRLASSLAHELCQPLAAILRNVEAAELLLARPVPSIEDLRAIIIDIHRDDQRAADIIDRLRSLLKRRKMQFQPLSPESLLTEVNMLVRADAAARQVALECRAQGPLPMISGDRVHLSQVLINLLQNGIDATCDVPDSLRRVTMIARTLDNTTVEIAVADSGAGLAAEAQTRLFEPFFTTKPGGMGMGLSVSRTIVEAHGGSLWAENHGQGGAIFHLQLPALATETA